MVEIAICYTGDSDSIQNVYQSHHENIFDVMKMAGIQYDVFIHTWNDSDNYQLLVPTGYRCDDKEEFLLSCKANEHRLETVKSNGKANDRDKEVILKELCIMESQKRVTEMAERLKDYDFIIYLGTNIIEKYFPIEILFSLKAKEIGLTMQENFAALVWKERSLYGKRINELQAFRKETNSSITEYRKIIIDKYFKRKLIDF